MGRAINEDELFFHKVRPEIKDDLARSMAAKKPLFSLRGRATLRRGDPFLRGDVFAFMIPQDEQPYVLESPSLNEYETWGKGSRQILALKNPITDEQQQTAKEWLRKRQQKDLPNSPVYESQIPLEDVRVLDSKYLIGHLRVEGDEKIKCPDGREKYLPKRIKFLNDVPPRVDVSVKEIQQAIKRAVLKGNTIL